MVKRARNCPCLISIPRRLACHKSESDTHFRNAIQSIIMATTRVYIDKFDKFEFLYIHDTQNQAVFGLRNIGPTALLRKEKTIEENGQTAQVDGQAKERLRGA